MSKAAPTAQQQQQQQQQQAPPKPIPCPYQCPLKLSGPAVEFEGYTYQTFSQQDHLTVRALFDTVEGCNPPWKLRFEENGTYTWDKKQEGEPMKMIKVFGVIPDQTPAMLYDVLHDPVYRCVWDERRLDGYRFTLLSPDCEIGYYAGKLGFALSDREFVNQRGWINVGNGEYLIWNTSVPVRRLPKEGKDRVRAISKVSGYLIRPWGDKGSSITYVTQTDPRGMIPSSLINFVTTRFAPSTITNFSNACKKYPEWVKAQGDKYSRPWMLNASGTTDPTPYPAQQRNLIYEWIAARAKTPGGAPPPMPANEAASPMSPPPPPGGPKDYWVQPASPASPAAAPTAAAAAAAAAGAKAEEPAKKDEQEEEEEEKKKKKEEEEAKK